MSETTDPTVPEAVDFRQNICRDCAFFAMRPDLAGGDCRESPPSFHPADPSTNFGRPWDLRYPSLVPASPACSRFMTTREWEGYRGRLSPLLADPTSAELVSALSRP